MPHSTEGGDVTLIEHETVEAPAEPRWRRLAQVVEIIKQRGLATGRLEDEHGQVCFYGAMRAIGHYPLSQVGEGIRPYGPDLEALARAAYPHSDNPNEICCCLDCSLKTFEQTHLSRDVCWSIITEANDSLPEARWVELIERTAYGV
jgi:hypothetical protein